MEVVGIVDTESTNRLRLAYSNMERDLAAIEPLVPNAGVQNDIDALAGLYLPLVALLREADWDLAEVDKDATTELEILSPQFQAELQRLIDGIERYGAYHCGHDLEAIRQRAVEDFEHQVVSTPP